MIYQNYVFHMNQTSANRIFWVCGQYARTKCRARCTTDTNRKLVRLSVNHNHPPLLPEEKVLIKL